jgi:predicted RNA-binding Zn-ribbon protein involved in translation (DUF1610 family)
VSRPGVERLVVVEFDCPACGGAVTATLKCAGSRAALAVGVAAVRLPCPHCGRGSRLAFELSGRVQAVEPAGVPAGPSWN